MESTLSKLSEVVTLGATWVWDDRGETVSWSDAVFRILGYDRASHVPSTESFLARVDPEQVEAVASFVRRGAAASPTEHIDAVVRRPDGTRSPVQIAVNTVFTPRGIGVPHVLASVVDQNELFEVAEASVRAKRVLAEVERLGNFGIVEVDVQSGRRHWSQGWRNILGVGNDVEPSLDEFFDRVHPADRQRLQSGRAELFKEGPPRIVEYRVIRPDGERRYVRMLGTVQRDSAGDVESLVSINFDITEARLLEQKLGNAAKLEAVGRLAGGVAHEINNLMMVVAMTANELRESSPEDAELLEDVVAAANKLTRPLLSVSGRAHLEIRAVSCADLVSEAVAKAIPTLGRDIEVDVRLTSEPAILDVDIAALQQALLNLLINARDALDRRGRVAVTTEVLAPDQVEIAVEDQGAGMTEDVRERVFEPFFTTKPPGAGTGLGLAIVRKTVEAQGGEIILDSELGRGTRVAIRLPCRPAVTDDATTIDEAADIAPLRVLVVDDNAMSRGAIRSLLEARGHWVVEAELPSEAIAALRQAPQDFDLLVSDLVMPEMLGPSMVGQLREEDLCPSRVVFVTGYGAAGSAMLRPDDILLRKPFGATELDDAIRRSDSKLKA